MSAFIVTKVVREIVPIDATSNQGEQTLGQLLDERIGHALQHGQEIQSVELEIDPTEWGQMLKQYHGSTEAIPLVDQPEDRVGFRTERNSKLKRPVTG